MEFQSFDKIARLSRECIITEKLDGTNAQVTVVDSRLVLSVDDYAMAVASVTTDAGEMLLYAGSRNRWVLPGMDNFGFAAWVRDNAEELVKLGPGRHFGEWWGQGIQRRYGLDEKRFSLFNVKRWEEDRPSCCHVVPVLFKGMFHTQRVGEALWHLRRVGSVAAPGFMQPEGVVVYHTASGSLFKKTLENDEVPKSTVKRNV